MNPPQIKSALENTDLMIELISDVEVLYNDSTGFKPIEPMHQCDIIARIEELHFQDKRRLLARFRLEARNYKRQKDITTTNYYTDLANYFDERFIDRTGNELEAKVQAQFPKLVELIESARQAYAFSLSQSPVDDAEYQKHIMPFEKMDLQTKRLVCTTLLGLSSTKSLYGDSDGSKLDRGAASFIWHTYVVPYSAPSAHNTEENYQRPSHMGLVKKIV